MLSRKFAGARTSTKFVTTLFLLAFLLPTLVQAQYIPGQVVRPASLSATKLILDPNQDGYVSRTTSGYSGYDDVSRPTPFPNPTGGANELPFYPVYPYAAEPNSDLRRGPNNRFSDYVPSTLDQASYYMYLKKSTLAPTDTSQMQLIFRVRMGSIIPGAKGFSYLIDIDGKFGSSGPNADPNYKAATTGTGGNPGFEVEVNLFTQSGSSNIGIAVYNIDGIDQPIPNSPAFSANNFLNYSQVSMAATADNGDPDYYIDFYIPWSWLGNLVFSSPTTVTAITTSTPLRIIPTTVMSPQPATGGPKSDIYGLNDALYKDYNSEYEVLLGAMPPFSADQMASGGGGTNSQLCTAAPILNKIATSSTTVTGYWKPTNVLTGTAASPTIAYATRAKIYLYRTRSSVTTIVDSSQITAVYAAPSVSFTISGLSILAGDQYFVRARGMDAGGTYFTEAPIATCALSSNTVTVSTCGPSNTPAAPVIPSCGGNTGKGFAGSNLVNTYTVIVKNVSASPNTSDQATYANTTVTTGNFGFTANSGSWNYYGGCNGSPMPYGLYQVTYQSSNGCVSDPTYVCATGNGSNALGTAGALTITSPTGGLNSITYKTTSITGSIAGASGTVIYTVNLFLNGSIASTTSTDNAGSFTFPGLSFSATDKIYFTHYVSSNTTASATCVSQSGTVNFSCMPTAPTINQDNAGTMSVAANVITGYSSEPGATVTLWSSPTQVTNPTTAVATTVTVTVNSVGVWTATLSVAPTNGTYYYAQLTKTNVDGSTCTSGFSTGLKYSSTVTSGHCTASPSFRAVDLAGNVTTGTGTNGITITPFVTELSVQFPTTANSATYTLYQDGLALQSRTKSSITGSPNDTVTFSAPGFFIPNSGSSGTITVGVYESGIPEQSCAYSLTVSGCAGIVATPSMAFSSCTSCGGTYATLYSGSTATFNISSVTTNANYGIRQQTVGTTYSNSYLAPSTAAFPLTTFPIITTAGALTLETVATKLVTQSIGGNVVAAYGCSTAGSSSGTVVTGIVLRGTLYDDWDGLNGIGTMSDGIAVSSVLNSSNVSIPLYVYLVNSSNVPIAMSSLSSGAYSFSPASIVSGSSYKLILSTNGALPLNSGTLSTATLPTGWVSTAEGTTNGKGDGSADGVYSVTAITTSQVIDFGINAKPVADSKTYTLASYNNPTVQTVSVASTAGNGYTYVGQIAMSGTASSGSTPGALTGTDKDGSAAGASSLTLRESVQNNTIVIDPAVTALRNGSSYANGAVLTYNGVQLYAGGCQGSDIGNSVCNYYNSSTGTWDITNYDLTLLKMLVRTGTGSYSFNYAWKDYAGTTGSYTTYGVSFTSPLPLHLLDFAAHASGSSDVNVQWHTASEVNTLRFEIEHSTDGVTFSSIGSVAAGGNVASAEYAYLHRNAPAGYNYYRLRMVDIDGRYTYSPVRMVPIGATGADMVSVYPNPAKGNSGARLSWSMTGAVEIRLIDAVGNTVYANRAATGNTLLVPTTGLPAGSYRVLLRSAGKTVATSLLIQ